MASRNGVIVVDLGKHDRLCALVPRLTGKNHSLSMITSQFPLVMIYSRRARFHRVSRFTEFDMDNTLLGLMWDGRLSVPCRSTIQGGRNAGTGILVFKINVRVGRHHGLDGNDDDDDDFDTLRMDQLTWDSDEVIFHRRTMI